MSGLHEVFDEVLPVLSAQGATQEAPSGTSVSSMDAGSLLIVLLEQVLDRKRARALVERMLAAGFLEPDAFAKADAGELAAEFSSEKPSVPPRTWRMLAQFLRKLGEWGEELPELPTERLREELRAISGLGPATVDAVLLLGLGRPVFPVERGTFRVLVRHGWVDPWEGYDEATETVAGAAGQRPEALRASWEGLGQVASRFCKPRVAECEKCPLRPFLPRHGPIEPEG